MFFCGETSCMNDDSDASKAAANNMRVREEPKDAAIKFGMGREYVNASLAKWRASEKQCSVVNAWVKEPLKMLVLVGKPRTGKTFFCAAVANYFMQQKINVRYLNSRRFFEAIQNAIANDKSQYEAIRQIASHEVLILDDIAAATNSEWQKEVLLDLMDQRYSNQAPTIVTTNLTEKDSEIALGGRTASRVFSNIVLEVM